MKHVWGILAALLTAACPAGGDVLNVVPDDAVVVVVARGYRESLEGLNAFFEAAVPTNAALPDAAKAANLAYLEAGIGLRDSVADHLAACDGPGLDAEGPAAIAVVVLPDSSLGVLTFRAADEAVWRKANETRIRGGIRGPREILAAEKPFGFAFHDGHLVTANKPEALDAYDQIKSRPLAVSRSSALRVLLSSNLLAANVSAPTAMRVWPASGESADDKAGRFFEKCAEKLSTGMSIIPFPADLICKATSDFLANGDEAYVGIDVTPEAVGFSGQVFLKSGGVYTSIASEHRTEAPDPIGVITLRPAVGVAVGFDGGVFWAYMKGFVPPFITGLAKTAAHRTASKALFNSAVDIFREKVSLTKAAWFVVCDDDWRCPAPVLVAQVPDGPDAMAALAGMIKRVYSDNMFLEHCKSLGFLLEEPVVEEAMSSGRRAISVTVPFHMSAANPVRAMQIREVLGASLAWRITSLTQGESQLVVAGSFPSSEKLDAFISQLGARAMSDTAAYADASTSDGGRTALKVFVDLPDLAAGRLKAALRSKGHKPVRARVPLTQNVCALSIALQPDQAWVSCSVPAEQIKGAFTAVRNVTSALSGATSQPSKPEKPSSPARRPSARSGRGRGAPERETPDKQDGYGDLPKSPWGRK